MGLKSFILAFSLQKLLAAVLLSICMTIQFYVGSRTDNAESWGAFGPTPYSFWYSLQGGVELTIIFFLFTLYPIATFVTVALGRSFVGSEAPNLVPWLSAALSVLYVLYWVGSLHFPFSAPYWIVTAIMAAFIVISSAALYPPMRAKPGGDGPKP